MTETDDTPDGTPDETPGAAEPRPTDTPADAADTGGATGTDPLVTPAPVVAVTRRRPFALLGAVVGTIGVVVGAVFAISALRGDPANTPQAAVQKFLDAVAKEDALGVMETLAPGERDVLLDSMVPMVEQLKRLDVLDPNLELDKVPGIEADFEDVRYETETLRDDLAAVTITGGTSRVKLDPSKLPLGEFVEQLTGDAQLSADVQEDVSQMAGDTPIVAVRNGGTWYVSFGYSIAEAARRDGGSYPVPPKGGGVGARGAESAPQAVGDMIRAIADLDVRRVIELLPPDEFAALHDYAGRFIGEAEEALVGARDQYDLTFPTLDLSAEVKGDRALVKIEKIGIDARLKTSDDTDVSVRIRGDCVTLSVDGESQRRCGREITKLVEDFGGPEVSVPRQTANAGSRALPDVGFVAVKRDGTWYVSPTRTLMDAMTNGLKQMSRADLDKLVDQAKKTVEETQGS